MPDCKHENLRFLPKSGSFYVECCHCDGTWMAIDPGTDTPRYEAMRESYGLTEERRAPFYMPAYTQTHQIKNALNLLKVTTSPTDRTKFHVDIEPALTLLFGRPQRDLLQEYKLRVSNAYVGKLPTEALKSSLLEDTKAFIQRVARTYTPK